METYAKATQTVESSTGMDDLHDQLHNVSLQNQSTKGAILYFWVYLEEQLYEEANPQSEAKKEEPEPLNPQEILKKEDFIQFLDRSARIVERAMVSSKKFDIAIDFSEEDSRYGRSADR